MSKNILIGGAWPYANNSLHLGHLAGLISGDILARYHRINGDNVLYVSGTEPLIRVMIEGKDKEYISKEAKELAEIIEEKLN